MTSHPLAFLFLSGLVGVIIGMIILDSANHIVRPCIKIADAMPIAGSCR